MLLLLVGWLGCLLLLVVARAAGMKILTMSWKIWTEQSRRLATGWQASAPHAMQPAAAGRLHLLQQQSLEAAAAAPLAAGQQQLQQLANMDPIALSAMLQRMSVTSPDMQLQQLQVPVSQPTQPALSSPAQLLQQQQQVLMMPQQQQQLLQLVSAPPAALAAPSVQMPAAASGVRPQLLLPGAAGVGGGLMHVASPSGLQQQQQLQLPATGGFDVSAFCGQHYTLQQLQW